MFDFLTIKKAVGDFSGQLKKIREEIASLQARRAVIEAAPPGREDIKASLGRYLDEQAGRYRESLSKSLDFFQRHPQRLNDTEAITNRMSLAGVPTSSANLDSTRTIDGMFAVLIPGMRAELHKQIDLMPWPADALPLEGRAKRLDDIDTKLDVLLNQEAELVAAASAAGIRIE